MMRIARQPAYDFLLKLGLTRFALFALLWYYLLSLGLEVALPDGEFLIKVPLNEFSSVLVLVCVFIVYAVLQELRRPRVLVSQRLYWVQLSYVMGTSLIYISFCPSFGFLKSLIPVFHPYYLDPWLQRIDIALHGGKLPFQFFMEVLPKSWILLLDRIYLVSWVSVIGFYSVWQLSRPPSFARTQFISCFFLTWIIGGIVLATLFSSVGPIYYNLFYHDAYSTMNWPLVQQLYNNLDGHQPLLNFNARQELIDFLNNGKLANYNGMSAMPSMHTGMSMLIAMHSYCYARKLFWIVLPYTILIIIGSMALGWHYGIDTYFSAIVLVILWRLNKWDFHRMARA